MSIYRMCLAVLAAGMAAHALAANPVDQYDLIWNSPSQDHHGSMPLGNGDLAANAWMTAKGDLHLYISKTDAWDDNARLVKVGKVRIHLEPNPIKESEPFRQELVLSKGAIEISMGKDAATRLRVWVDANHPVICVEADSAAPMEVTANIELWRTNREEIAELQVSDVFTNRKLADGKLATMWVEPDSVLANQPGRIGWCHHNLKSVGPSILAEVQGLTGFPQPDPLLHRTFGGIITARGGERLDGCRLRSPAGKTHRFNIHVVTRHPATPQQWLEAITESMRRVEAISVEKRFGAHTAWWKEFWGRSWIRASASKSSSPAPSSSIPTNRHAVRAGVDQSVDGKLAADTIGATVADEAFCVSQAYHLQRYITACAGRGAYPIKFNGSLFTVPPGPTERDPDYRRWGPGYWWQNSRLPYISLCTSGDFDLQQALFRMYARELLPLCKYRTQLYLGHRGAYYPECIMFWGAVFGETYGWTPFAERKDKLQQSGWHKWEWVGGLELCWMMLDYYDHLQDKQFLNDTALPFTRDILGFFEQHYPTNADGKLVFYPSQALETWWQCTNATPELAGCIAVTERLTGLPGGLLNSADRERLLRFRARLPSLPLREVEGKTALAPAQFFAQKRNIENPELYPVFPFRLFAFNRPNVDWAIQALKHRADRGNFGWRQDEIFMAYLGATEEAREFLVRRAKSHDRQERFPAFWGPNYDWTPDQDHGGVLMKAFQAMLLQSDGRQLFLLPAWPKSWNVEFKLNAPQKTILEGSFRDGKLISIRVTPKFRRADLTVCQ